ncbi:hypothetical protein ACLOJK_034635 [Asimina triloba]
MARKEDMKAFYFLAVMGIALLLCCTHAASGLPSDDPAYGFVSLPLNSSNLVIQRPYDLPESSRYSFIDGVHRLWVYATDKPHSPTSNTKPRTEIRIHEYGNSKAMDSFQMGPQVFGASTQATTAAVTVYNGSLTYYRNPIIVPYIYDRWFRLNVIHDVEAKNVSIFIDGVLKLTVADHGGTSHYFKCGVYTQVDSSDCMESRWKDIKVLRKM